MNSLIYYYWLKRQKIISIIIIRLTNMEYRKP